MKKFMSKKHIIISNIVMTIVLICTLFLGSFAYWGTKDGDVNIPTHEFNATEDEFSYYACVPNLAANTGYDYYDIDYIPDDLNDRVVGLACVRFEALTSTAYIPPFPEIQMNGKKYNANGSHDLPVIHMLNSVQINDSAIDNGFLNIENLIIPDTVTFIQPGAFKTSTKLKEVSFLGSETSGNVFFDHTELEGKTVRYQHANRNIVYRIEAESKKQIEMMQFIQGGELEFEYLTNKFINYILPAVEINSLVVQKVDKNQVVKPLEPVLKAAETPVNYETKFDKPLQPGTIYKLEFDRTTNKLTALPYTYSLEIESNGAVIDTIPLTMNTKDGYEYYELDHIAHPCGTTTILDKNAKLKVYEYVNGVKPDKPDVIFDLQYLQAPYNMDNDVYHIRYSPINVYVSRHYYMKDGILTSKLTPKQLAVEKAYFLNTVTKQVTNDVATLNQIAEPKLMVRNYSNEEFEEYMYYDYTGSNLTGSYIVSNICDQNKYFGGDSKNPYYGIINETSPLGELEIQNQNLILFTPNRGKNYGERYFGVFDEYDHLLETLDFNESNSLESGIQYFDATIPLSKHDYSEIVVKEVDAEGNILNGKELFRSDIDAVNKTGIKDTSVLFAPYFLGEKSNLNAFVRTSVDANQNVYYLFKDAKIEKGKDYYIKEIVGNDKVVLSNDMDLPFQVIDGFFYSDVQLTGKLHDSFRLPESGYYDLMIRERKFNGVNHRFVGFKYRGLDPRPSDNNYLQQWKGDTLVNTFEMTRTNNHFMSYVDFQDNSENEFNYKVVDTYGTMVHSFKIEHFSKGFQRLYYGDEDFLNQTSATDTTLIKTRHAPVHLNEIHLSFNFGTPPKVTQGDTYFNTDDPFTTLIKSSADIEYVTVVQGIQHQVMPVSIGRPGLHIGYLVVTDKNQDIIIEHGKEKINAGKVSFPGVYKIIYNSEDKTVEYTKIQKPRFYNIYLDGKVVNALVANTDVVKHETAPAAEIGPDKYLEFKSPALINVNKEVHLNPNENPHNDLSVRDENLNVITQIESITLDGVKTDVIPVGTYEFYYSIDSTRRVGDKYHVFTYFRLVSRPTASVTYHYQEANGQAWKEYYRQMDATNGTQLVAYENMPTVPRLDTDFKFVGWSTSKQATKVDYEPNAIVTLPASNTTVDLYPVFKQNDHAYLELSAHNFDSSGPIQFSVSNIGDGEIFQVDIGTNIILPEGEAFNKDVLESKYIHIKNNVITIDVALCEIIGYIPEGQNFIVHVRNLDKTEYTISTYLPYPDFSFVEESK